MDVTGSYFIISTVHEATVLLVLRVYLQWLVARQCVIKVLTHIAVRVCVCVFVRE